MTRVTRYHPLLAAMHWLLAAFIIAALALGALVRVRIPNSDPMKIEALRSHMTGGSLILLLMLGRLALRLRSAHPPAAPTGHVMLDRLAWASHRLFYVAVIAQALSGLAMALEAHLPQIVFFGQGQLPVDFWIYPLRSVHYFFSRLLMLLIAMHVAGVLYHTFILNDGLLRRMGFGRREASGAGVPQSAAPGNGRLGLWLNRLVLAATATILLLIARKFIGDPVGAAAASNMELGSALAVTNMRASFGAFPLAGALMTLICLASARRHAIGLSFVGVLMATVLMVRIFGVIEDGTLSESLRVIMPEAMILLLTAIALLLHRQAARRQSRLRA